MTSIKLRLNTSRVLKDSTFPLVFQIIHCRKKKLIYTSFKLFVQEFDPVKERVYYISDQLRTQKEIRRINRKIAAQRKEIEDYVMKIGQNGMAFALLDINFRYKAEAPSHDLLHYIDLLIADKKELGRDGTVAAYRSTRASLAAFIGKQEVKISRIDGVFLQEYERFLRLRNVCDNTICFYMRNFKAIYNQATISNPRPTDENPFRSIRLKPRKTIKRALSQEIIRKMAELDLSGKKNLEITRDLFLFSFYSRGMSFVDVLFLKISSNEILYNRKKTQQSLHISLTPQLSALIEKYRSDSEYVFPILRPESSLPLYQQYRRALERVNRNLKQIAKLLGIKTPLTTYAARHSWATLAKDGGAPIALISEGLGHTSEHTTQIYLKEFDQKAIDQLNERISKLDVTLYS